MTKPNWRTAEQFPEFGDTIFAKDDYGRYVVLRRTNCPAACVSAP